MTEPGVLDDNFMTVDQVAEVFQVTPYTVRVWCKAKKIRAAKIGKQWRIQRSAVQAFAQKQFGDNE